MAATSEAIFFETPAALRDWLDEHHTTADDLIVGAWKKSTGKPSLTWPEIVEEALCVGWIDSIRRSVPDDGWTIRLTPRRKGSTWSAVNVAKVAELREAGRMRAAGEAAFAARRADRTGVYSFERVGVPELAPEDEARFRAERSRVDVVLGRTAIVPEAGPPLGALGQAGGDTGAAAGHVDRGFRGRPADPADAPAGRNALSEATRAPGRVSTVNDPTGVVAGSCRRQTPTGVVGGRYRGSHGLGQPWIRARSTGRDVRRRAR